MARACSGGEGEGPAWFRAEIRVCVALESLPCAFNIPEQRDDSQGRQRRVDTKASARIMMVSAGGGGGGFRTSGPRVPRGVPSATGLRARRRKRTFFRLRLGCDPPSGFSRFSPTSLMVRE